MIQDNEQGEGAAIMGWQPIETAPRDGTVVKLLIPYEPSIFSEEQCADVGYWQDWSQASMKRMGMDWEKWGGGCWRFNGDDGEFDIQPTHWMPLPSPPEPQQ